MSIFGMAFSVAYAVFFPVAGWVLARARLAHDVHGRRSARDAARGAVFGHRAGAPAGPRETRDADESWAVSLRWLAASRTYLLLLLGSAFMGANVYAASAWFPTFLSRVHGLNVVQIASYVGPLRGILGAVGILGGGWLADRLGRGDPRWRLCRSRPPVVLPSRRPRRSFCSGIRVPPGSADSPSPASCRWSIKDRCSRWP